MPYCDRRADSASPRGTATADGPRARCRSRAPRSGTAGRRQRRGDGRMRQQRASPVLLDEFYAEVAGRARDAGVQLPHKIRLQDAHPDGNGRRSRTLAEVYEDTDYEFRKRLGQFATPPAIAEFMVSYGLGRNVKSVLDPACGIGVFLDKLLEAGSKARLYGIDVDPMMINACYLDMQTRHGAPAARRLRLLNADYLAGSAGVPQADFLVCNPPYVNFHGFDRELTVRVGHETGARLSKLTNLYALFMLKAPGSVVEGGTMVFITPAEFFYTGYGRAVKSFMVENLTLDAFVTFDFARTVFDNALTTSTISIMTNKKPAAGHRTAFVTTKGSLEGVRRAIEGHPRKGVRVRLVRQDSMDPGSKWQNYLAGASPTGGPGCASLVPLSREADVKRGIASGSNDFFTLADFERAQWKIEDRFLAPVVSRAKQSEGYEITRGRMKQLAAAGHKVHLLYCTGPPSANLRRYIRDGERRGINKRYLCRHRTPWYSTETRRPAPILATVFSRDNMRFIHNKAKCLNLASYHGVYPHYGSSKMIKALLCYLNSVHCTAVQKTARREYGDGLHKFEPGDLLQLPVLPVSRLDAGTVSELALLFDRTCGGARGARERADRRVAEVIASLGPRG